MDSYVKEASREEMSIRAIYARLRAFYVPRERFSDQNQVPSNKETPQVLSLGFDSPANDQSTREFLLIQPNGPSKIDLSGLLT